MRQNWRLIGTFVLPVGLLLAGCTGDAGGVKGPSPVTTAPGGPAGTTPANLEPKKAPLPELPEGAGEMDADAPEELTATPSGLYYRILRKSDGKKPTVSNTVAVHYHGWLDNGKVFDSSYQKGDLLVHPLARLVDGWKEGLPMVGEGGMIELEIPSELGYGATGTPGGPVPPNATLHFIVELKEVK